MKHLLLILLLMPFATYGETYLTVNLGSKHFNEEKAEEYNYNEENFGIGINYNGYLLGQYKNSFNKNSVYAGYEFKNKINKYIGYGVRAGLVTGYTDKEMPMANKGDIKIFAVPQVSFGDNHTKFFVGVIPGKDGFISFQLELKL